MTERARYGWESSFRRFENTPPNEIRSALQGFVRDASAEQVRAWDDSIPPLQREVREVLTAYSVAAPSSAVLEYELPMESRRPDVIFLVGRAVIVIELKGKQVASQADIDQAGTYARDLRCYHRECADRDVVPIVVPTRARGYVGERGGVHVAGPDAVDELTVRLGQPGGRVPLSADTFLAEEAYRPLPMLVRAARELFSSGEVRSV